MFNTIRSMVDQKATFLETAELIYEEATGIPDDVFAEDDDSLGGDFPADETPTQGEDANHNDDDEGVPGDMDDMLSVKFSTSPAAAPINDDPSDLLSVTIDMSTNTGTDILPVPPINAGDALSDDPLSTRIGDGFDPTVEGTTGTEEVITEAITLDGGDGKGDKPEEGQAAAEKDGETSPVTDAVMDKVAETESLPVEEEGPSAQAKIQDKLDKFQKQIMDLKELVKKGLDQ